MSTLKNSLEELQSLAKERTVKTQTIEYDLETFVKKIKREVIKLNPDYQRRHRWSNEISSRLIESLILNIPIPFVYISQDIDVDEEIEDGHARYSVIDGQQRLTAIFDFFENKYPLTGLEVLEKLNDSYYRVYRSSYHLTPASNRCLVYATLVRTSFGINFRPFLNML